MSSRMRGWQQDHLCKKDLRLQKVVEVINHIKVLKFNVWETTFEKGTMEARKSELHSLQGFLMMQALQVCLAKGVSILTVSGR